jgi:hypothetical protein
MRVFQFMEEQTTSKSGAYMASIQFLLSDVERMVDARVLDTLCLPLARHRIPAQDPEGGF